MISLNPGDRYFPASCTTSPDCAKPCVAGWSSCWWWTLSPNKFSPSASVWDQIEDSKIKDAGEAPEVVIPFVFVHTYFYVTQYFQSETCSASRGRAAPRCCRILCGTLVHLDQKLDGDGAVRGMAASSQIWHFYCQPPSPFLFFSSSCSRAEVQTEFLSVTADRSSDQSENKLQSKCFPIRLFTDLRRVVLV